MNYSSIVQLYESQTSTIFRAIRKIDKKPVVLKILRKDFPTADELTQFQQVYLKKLLRINLQACLKVLYPIFLLNKQGE